MYLGHTGGCYGKYCKVYRGATQGGLLSPRILDVMVNIIMREWLRQVFGEGAARLGMGEDIAICFGNLLC